jgi:beta-glucosidase
VELQPGEETVVRFSVPTTRLAFSDRAMRRIVEPGAVEVWVGPSCAERETAAELTVTGSVHEVTPADARLVTSTVEAATVGAVFTDAL